MDAVNHNVLKNSSWVKNNTMPTARTKMVVKIKWMFSEYSRNMCLKIGLNVNNSNEKHMRAKQCKFEDNLDANNTPVNNAAFMETVHLNSRFWDNV